MRWDFLTNRMVVKERKHKIINFSQLHAQAPACAADSWKNFRLRRKLLHSLPHKLLHISTFKKMLFYIAVCLGLGLWYMTNDGFHPEVTKLLVNAQMPLLKNTLLELELEGTVIMILQSVVHNIVESIAMAIALPCGWLHGLAALESVSTAFTALWKEHMQQKKFLQLGHLNTIPLVILLLPLMMVVYH